MLKSIPALAEFDRGDGICIHIKNNLCEVYANRPLVCNTEKMYKLYFKVTMTEKQYILNNLTICKKLAEDKNQITVQKNIEEIHATYL
jgi:Fe-S-cluster containining protein